MRNRKRLISQSCLAALTGGFLGLFGGVGVTPVHASLQFDLKLTKIDGLYDVPPEAAKSVIATATDQAFALDLNALVTSPNNNGFQSTIGDFTQSPSGPSPLTGVIAPAGDVVNWPPLPPTQIVGVGPYNAYGSSAGTPSSGNLLGVGIRAAKMQPEETPPDNWPREPGDPGYTSPFSATIGKITFTGGGGGGSGGGITQIQFNPKTKTGGGYAEDAALWAEQVTDPINYPSGSKNGLTGTIVTNSPAPQILSGGNITMSYDTAVAVRPSATHNIGTLTNAAGKSLYVIGPGTLNINGAQNHGAGAKLIVNDGTVNLNTDAGPSARNLALTVNGSALVNLNDIQHLDSITINGPSNVKVAPTFPGGHSRVVVTNSFTMQGNASPTGRYDTDNAAMVVMNPGAGRTQLDNLEAQVKSGRGNYDENYILDYSGPGITSQYVRNYNVTQGFDLIQVNVISNSDLYDVLEYNYSTFAGQPVNPNSILLKVTWCGDITLDGIVDADDYALIDSGFLGLLPGYSGIIIGDLDLNGVVDGDDYALMDTSFLFQTGPMKKSYKQAAVPIPEPGGLALAGATLSVLLGARRRRAG